jgi:hypothetical protein
MNFINAIAALSMINEGGADYQEEYRKYIYEHKKRVKQFADWMKENLPEIFNEPGLDDFDELISEHDDSKFSEEEFEPYAQKFYGKQDINGKPLEYIPGWDEAWEHHWMNNEHHPEFWLGKDMPYIYILEMLCDWGSFSIAKGNLIELIDYYYSEARDDEEKNLSDNTKIIIEEILSKIENVIKGGDRE